MAVNHRFGVAGMSSATALFEISLARNLGTFLRVSDFEVGHVDLIPVRNERLLARLEAAQKLQGAEHLIQRAGAYAASALETDKTLDGALKLEATSVPFGLSSAVLDPEGGNAYWDSSYGVAGVLATRIHKAVNQPVYPIKLYPVFFSQGFLGSSGIGPTQSADMAEVIVQALVLRWRRDYEQGNLATKVA